MKYKTFFASVLITAAIYLLGACGNDKKSTEEKPAAEKEAVKEPVEVHGAEVKSGDITLSTPLNQEMVTAGKGMYELKCQSCHRLTDVRLVGPGWFGVTKRREPEWIMNMITNVEMMLETDPEAQKLLEQCLVRMPNLSVSREQAREVIEFMRSNDGIK